MPGWDAASSRRLASWLVPDTTMPVPVPVDNAHQELLIFYDEPTVLLAIS